MTTALLESVASHPLAQSIGWALAHSAWQGALVAVAFAAASRMLRESSAQARYVAGCAALALMVALPVTTVLKTLQIMTEKGLVERDESQRAHLYVARAAQDVMQQQLLTDLLERAFDGSASKLVMRALSSKKASAKELGEIRAMLDAFERGEDVAGEGGAE